MFEVNFFSVEEVRLYALTVAAGLQELRTQFAGKDYGAARDEMKATIRSLSLNHDALERLLSTPLS